MKKTALVTGSDRGVGLALVKVLLSNGYKVFAGSFLQDWPDLMELKEKHETQLVIVPLDVRSDESVQQAVSFIQEHTDSLDLLLNNAGIYKVDSNNIFEPFIYENMRLQYETNTLGPLRVTHSFLPLLLKGNEKLLVNISSEAGSIGSCWRKGEIGYCMTKAALNMQLAILQNALQEYGVKIFAIHPGWVRSHIMDGVYNPEAAIEPEESAAGIYEQILKPYSFEKVVYVDYQGNLLEW